MKALARRSVLRGLAAAPLGAEALATDAKMRLAGITHGAVQAGDIGMSPPSGEPLRFLDFASWFTKVGKDAIEREARYINGLDPDLIEMRLPFATKMRMQRVRNEARILEDKKDWFARQLFGKRVVEWWP